MIQKSMRQEFMREKARREKSSEENLSEENLIKQAQDIAYKLKYSNTPKAKDFAREIEDLIEEYKLIKKEENKIKEKIYMRAFVEAKFLLNSKSVNNNMR